MKIGAMNRPGKDLFDEISWIGRQGFDFVDLTFGPPAADLDKLDGDSVRNVLEEHELAVVAQAPPHLPLSSPHGTLRHDALGELRRCVQMAHRIGSTTLTAEFTYPDKSFHIDDVVAWYAEVLGPLCKEAAEVGVSVLLANTLNGGSHQLNYILSIMERVPTLRLQLSSSHANLEPGLDHFDEYLKRFGRRLMHIHLSDNEGTGNQHLPLGCAPRSAVNWPQRIRQIKQSGYDGTITLEVFSPERDYLLLSRNLLQKWWNAA